MQLVNTQNEQSPFYYASAKDSSAECPRIDKPCLKLLQLSILTCTLLATSLVAEDYISVQTMYYDEDSGRTTISTPSIELNKDFGTDYTLNLSFAYDSVSGASPIFIDSTSGASAKVPEGLIYKNDIKFTDVEYEDKRKAVGATLTKRFESRDELTVGLNVSNEYDYKSKEISAEYLHYLDSSKNSSISFGTSYQKNDVSLYCSLNTGDCDSSSGASEKVYDLDVISSEIGYTQTIDKTSQAKVSLFYIDEDGYLSNPYMRVVRDYNSNPKITAEKKPDTRTAYGIRVEYSKAINEKLSSVSSYRFYDDDWDITSHTINSELYYEYNTKLTLGGGLRYYTQSEAKFYSGKKDYFTDQEYASSDRRMSEFDSFNYMVSADYKINAKVSVNGSVNYYDQPDWLDAIYYNLGVKYRF